jgi:hypothetical protein
MKTLGTLCQTTYYTISNLGRIKQRLYTTRKRTEYHDWLREKYHGITYWGQYSGRSGLGMFFRDNRIESNSYQQVSDEYVGQQRQARAERRAERDRAKGTRRVNP